MIPSGYLTVCELERSTHPFLIGKPSISIRAMASMAMLVITRWYTIEFQIWIHSNQLNPTQLIQLFPIDFPFRSSDGRDRPTATAPETPQAPRARRGARHAHHRARHCASGGTAAARGPRATCKGINIYSGYPPVNIQKPMENHHFWWEHQLFLWQFSIAMLNYQRVTTIGGVSWWTTIRKWVNKVNNTSNHHNWCFFSRL